MSDGVWISIMGFAALGAVIWVIMRDAAKSPIVAAMHEPAQISNMDALPSFARPQTADNWRGAGWLIMLGGAVGLLVSLLLKTSVETYAPALLGAGGTSEVVNLDLLFRKGIAVACSLAALGAGLFCLAIGSVIGAIHARPA